MPNLECGNLFLLCIQVRKSIILNVKYMLCEVRGKRYCVDFTGTAAATQSEKLRNFFMLVSVSLTKKFFC